MCAALVQDFGHAPSDVFEAVSHFSKGFFPEFHSAPAAALACSITAGACWVGMRTRVCGKGGSESCLVSASSSSFGLGIIAMPVRY